MTRARRTALALAIPLLTARLAAASCTSRHCPDQAAIDAVRAQIGATCNCEGAKNHGEYVSCARGVISAKVKDHTLAKSCKGAVGRCEAKSLCALD